MTFVQIVTQEAAEFEVLGHMTAETHKFVVPVGQTLEQQRQDALERLMLRDWIRLIDISPAPTAQPFTLFRVFKVMPEAVAWFERYKAAL